MALASDPLVELRNVTYGYGARPVLQNIDMAIPRGKVVAIMGISGSGKTTILRLIGGVVKAQRGAVRFDGEAVDPGDRDALFRLRRRMGMLFQFGALFTDLSVYDNVAFQIREHTNLPETMIRDLVLMKLHAVGLRAAQGSLPGELSGGQARRVALARAIALDPTLVMYDEPFTGLDPIALGVVANLVRRLNDALGSTSIVVTHDVSEALEVVDYVYYLADGRILAQGTPDELRANANPVLQQFVRGSARGPVSNQYPSRPIAEELGL